MTVGVMDKGATMTKGIFELLDGNVFTDEPGQMKQYTVSITAPDGTVYQDEGVVFLSVDPGRTRSVSSMKDHTKAWISRRWEMTLSKLLESEPVQVFGDG